MAVERPTPPNFNTIVLRWTYHDLYEKDDDFEVVLKDGLPIVADSWVELYLIVPSGDEVMMEVEKDPFEKYILPPLIEPSIAFWTSIRSGSPLHRFKAEMLEILEKSRR